MSTKFFPLNLSKFKRVSSDKHTTTLRHDDGHEVKIAHNALSPKLRGNLAALPEHKGPAKPTNANFKMAKGGKVNSDPTQRHLLPGDAVPNATEKYAVNSIKSRMDTGGRVEEKPEPGPAPELVGPQEDMIMDDTDPTVILMHNEKTPKPENMAKGGEPTPTPTPSPEEQIEQDQAELSKKRLMAEGGDPADVTPPNAPQAMDPTDLPQPNRLSDGSIVIPPEMISKLPPEMLGGSDRQPAAQEQKPMYDQEALRQKAPVMYEGKAPVNSSIGPMRQGAPAQTPPQRPAPQSQLPTAQAGAQGQAAQGSQDPYGTAVSQEAYSQGMKENRAGILGEAKAMGAQGQAEAAQLEQAVQDRQQAQNFYQEHYNELDKERKHFQNDIDNFHIDPQHYLNSKGTGAKIATGIGLILGGMGGAMSGQSNMAMDFVNRQIDNDIKAQQAELGKKENLLSANMKQFGNLRDATDMTRIMQNDIVSMQLKKAAANAATPLAASRALQAVGKLDMETAQMQGQLAMRRTLLSSANAGRIDPAKVVNLLVPESQRAAANKELTDAQNMVKARDNTLIALDQVAKINTLSNRLANPIQAKRQVEALMMPIVAQISKETAGRFTTQDADMLSSLFHKMGNSPETDRINRAAAVRLMSEKMHFPILETYGINIGNSGRFNNQGQSNIPAMVPPVKRR